MAEEKPVLCGVVSASPVGASAAPLMGHVGASLSGRVSCGCGCVPQSLSLFEMAELRKQAKEKRQAQEAAAAAVAASSLETTPPPSSATTTTATTTLEKEAS